jgi:hypothetical protein
MTGRRPINGQSSDSDEILEVIRTSHPTAGGFFVSSMEKLEESEKRGFFLKYDKILRRKKLPLKFVAFAGLFSVFFFGSFSLVQKRILAINKMKI